METKRLESNVQKVFWLNGSFSFMVLMPIIVPFFQSRGLDMRNVYELQAIFAGCVLLLEVPSGYFSDLVGRKGTLVIASLFHCLGFLVMALAPGYTELVVSEVLLALAISLFSGTDLSLLYDSLEALGSKKATIKIVGRTVFFRNTGESFAGLLGGWLLLWHFEAPAIAQAAVGLVPLLIALTLYEPPRKKMSAKKHRENLRYIWKALFGHSNLLTLIILTGVFYSFVTLAAVWMFQEYWQSLGVSLTLFGYLWFAINIAVAITGRFAHKIEKALGSEGVLLLMGIMPVLGFLGMGFVGSIWGLLFCFCFQICRGLTSVVMPDALNKRVAGDMRATANSIMSLGTRILMVGIGPIIGAVIDRQGLPTAMTSLGYLYVGVFLVLLLPLLALRKQFDPIPRGSSKEGV